jgi:hypothetical protein
MLLNRKYHAPVDGLNEQLKMAPAITRDLISAVIGQACVRFNAIGGDAKAKINRLIEVGAWTDAMLALIALELPEWKLRRLLFEDGEWHCALSRQPLLAFGLDELAESHHEVLPLAILMALLEARRATGKRPSTVSAVPQVQPGPSYAVCRDNFS